MTFADLIQKRLPARTAGAEPLASLPYPQEVQLKNEAFAEFWKLNGLEGTPQPLVQNPLPRGYRTTTKRRAQLNEQRGFALDFPEQMRFGFVGQSSLEPASHNAIYKALFEKFSTPAYRAFARALNWVIIRGNYTQHCVILNVVKLDAEIVRKAKQLAEWLPKLGQGVTSAMLYVDPTRSDYYLEAERPEEGLESKHLFGPRLLTLAVEEQRLKYPPTGFSQVNEAMVPLMVATARTLLAPVATDRLLDLYCGYGLFSFSLLASVRDVIGVELPGDSLGVAVESTMRWGLGRKLRFIPARITGEFVRNSLPAPVAGQAEVILLDPPRQGVESGVVAGLAARKPRRVLQICCGTDEIVPAMRDWKACGYRIEGVVPLDLFSGTANLETFIALVPK